MNEAAKYMGIGAIGAYVFGAAADVFIYALGIMALIAIGAWFYAVATQDEEEDDGPHH